MGALIPHKECKFGIAVQTAQGSPATEPTVLFPVYEENDLINWKKNYSFFQYSDDMYAGPSHFHTEGETAEGSITLPIVPGMLATAGGSGGLATDPPSAASDITDIGLWCFARQNLATYYGQALWATLFKYTGHKKEIFSDCKVGTGSINVGFGNIATMEINVQGITTPTAWTEDGTPAITAITRAPYVFNHASLSLAGGAEMATNDHVLSFDNNIEALGTLAGAVTHTYMPNSQLAVWTGEFSRLWYDSGVYDAFMAGTEVVYQLTLDNSIATAVIGFPRCLYTDADVTHPASGVLNQASIPFQCLGQVTAGPTVAYAFTITETVK